MLAPELRAGGVKSTTCQGSLGDTMKKIDKGELRDVRGTT